MMLFLVRVKGVAGRGRCFAPLTRFDAEKNVEMTWKGTKDLSGSCLPMRPQMGLEKNRDELYNLFQEGR